MSLEKGWKNHPNWSFVDQLMILARRLHQTVHIFLGWRKDFFWWSSSSCGQSVSIEKNRLSFWFCPDWGGGGEGGGEGGGGGRRRWRGWMCSRLVRKPFGAHSADWRYWSHTRIARPVGDDGASTHGDCAENVNKSCSSNSCHLGNLMPNQWINQPTKQFSDLINQFIRTIVANQILPPVTQRKVSQNGSMGLSRIRFKKTSVRLSRDESSRSKSSQKQPKISVS